MAARRIGTIEWRSGKAHARVWVPKPEPEDPDKKVRIRVDLGTRDPNVAERMLAKVNRQIESGELTFANAGGVADAGPEEFGPFALTWVKERADSGVAMAGDEKRNLDKHVLPVVVDGRAFATMCIVDVRPRHIVAILQSAIDKGLAKGTVEHIKRMLSRIFSAAIAADILAPGTSPVTNAKTPRIPDAQRITKKRVVLTDDEVAKFFACNDVDLELRMMSLVSRVEGGMRTSDVNRWDWSQIDVVDFTWCKVPRQKKDRGPQTLEIPEMLRPFLKAWWISANCATRGPVFPVTKGARKGEFRARRGVSYARRLRRALKKAGVTRRELFVETADTLPVDFHSFRRAFSTALAEAGVNAQTAMALSDHSDPKTHQRYIAETTAMKRIPLAALPPISGQIAAPEYPARDSANRRTDEPLEFERETGLEPATLSLGSRRDAVSALKSADGAPVSADADPPSAAEILHARTPVATAGHGEEARLGGVEVALIGAPTVAHLRSVPLRGQAQTDAPTFGRLVGDSLALDGGDGAS